MARQGQGWSLTTNASQSGTKPVTLLVVLVLAVVAICGTVQAQTYHKLWDFTGGADGFAPIAGLTMDKLGNFYGTASNDGYYGVVFKLSGSGSNWSVTPLYTFTGAENNDGAFPYGPLTFGPDGALYGTTLVGGTASCPVVVQWEGCGTVFRLSAPGKVCLAGPGKCPWQETILHNFTSIPDGALPFSSVTFASPTVFYGTTWTGGYNGGCYDLNGCGTVFKFTKAGNTWTLTDTYRFTTTDGQPYGGVILDSTGNLYGTTACCYGPPGDNIIYKLVPPPAGWIETTLHTLQQTTEGSFPFGQLVFDSFNNLYGTTSSGGANGAGTAFQFTNAGVLNVLQTFAGYPNDGCGPPAGLIMDSAGDLFGTTNCDGAYGYGSVFELKNVSGTYVPVPLYDFTDGADGGLPYGGLVMDANGFLYGTASAGGAYRNGVIFQIMP